MSKFNKIKKFLFPLVAAPLIATPIVTACSSIDEIKQYNPNSWRDSINEIANSECPTIYITNNATLPFTQLALMWYTSSEIARNQGKTYENEKYRYADQVFIIPWSFYHYKTNETQDTNVYDYQALITREQPGASPSYVDMLKSGWIKSDGTTDPTVKNKGNHMIITNLEDFDTSTNTYSDNADNTGFYVNSGTIDVRFFDKLFSLYDENIRFNFIICDSVLVNLLSTHHDIAAKLFNRANKFYTVSDGSNTHITFLNFYKSVWNKRGYTSADQQRQIWENMHKSVRTAEYELLINSIALMNNQKYFVFFDVAGDFWKSSVNYDNNTGLNQDTIVKWTCANLFWESYKDVFNLDNQTLSYIDANTKLFFDKDCDLTNINFEHFTCMDSYKNYSKSKKNVIIGLPRYVEEENAVRDANIKEIFDKLISNYPTSEYNYIVKPHPRIPESQYEEVMLRIFGQSLNNITYIKSSYPLEVLVAIDWSMNKNGLWDHYYFIDPNSLEKDEKDVSGILAGFQTTSSINMTTLAMSANYYLSNNKQVGWNNALKILGKGSNFTPSKFNAFSGYVIPTAVVDYQKTYDGIYDQFISIGQFKPFDYFEVV